MKDFLILVIQTDWKVAKDLATKAATKANEKQNSFWKQNRSAYRTKICDKFNTRKGEKKSMTLPKR